LTFNTYIADSCSILVESTRKQPIWEILRVGYNDAVPLTSFQIGKLRIAAHVREELDLAGIAAESIQCVSDGVHLPFGHTRLTITVHGTPAHLDLTTHEVEDCAVLVAGEPWRRIAAFIGHLMQPT